MQVRAQLKFDLVDSLVGSLCHKELIYQLHRLGCLIHRNQRLMITIVANSRPKSLRATILCRDGFAAHKWVRSSRFAFFPLQCMSMTESLQVLILTCCLPQQALPGRQQTSQRLQQLRSISSLYNVDQSFSNVSKYDFVYAPRNLTLQPFGGCIYTLTNPLQRSPILLVLSCASTTLLLHFL